MAQERPTSRCRRRVSRSGHKKADAERYETALHPRASIISCALRRLEIDRIAAEVESFVAALQRDLIVAADVAR